jgi:peptidoglycan LD-endopeptidase LytH
MVAAISARILWLVPLCLAVSPVRAQPLQLPTANRALFEPGHEEEFFVGTVGKPWTSGCFGCVRSDGWQMHEGLDIRCLQRDRRGEPADPVKAAADGTVAYVNAKPSLSNYGNYVVLQHRVEGLEIYSLYAHLREAAAGLKAGQSVKAGDTIGIMGHTSNTRAAISKDRAHVHFELDLLVSDRFAGWFRKTSPTERNDHGNWNGQNMLGLDPRQVLIAERDQGDQFSLLGFIRSQTQLCRVLVRRTNFPWLQRYAALVRPNPTAEKEGVAGYEIALNFNGVPFELIPRAASEIDSGKSMAKKARDTYRLLSVNEAEYQNNHCRRLIAQRRGRWELTTRGINLLDLLTY